MSKKILVVDDERHIVRLVTVNLQRAGFETISAENGREALEKVRDEKPDAVVLDILMPYVDGWEVIKAMKSSPETQNIPIIVLTNLKEDKDVFRGWQMGADVYLPKPFNPMEVVTFVRRQFEKQEGS